jgi:hypothetical protein
MGGVGMTLAGATLLSEGCCVVREIEEVLSLLASLVQKYKY